MVLFGVFRGVFFGIGFNWIKLSKLKKLSVGIFSLFIRNICNMVGILKAAVGKKLGQNIERVCK